MTVYAAFESAVEVAEITDSWDTIIANIDNGTYATRYKVGNYKPMTYNGSTTVNMQIVAINGDDLEGGGKAPLSFISIEALNDSWNRNGMDNWSNSLLRSYLNSTVLGRIEANIKSRICRVRKFALESSGMVETIDKLFLPSSKEIGINTNIETASVVYKIFTDNNSRKKKYVNDTSYTIWGTRTTNPVANVVNTNGELISLGNSDNAKIVLGFCLGLEQETITDDWSTILANTNYATDYSIGDTKELDLGTEGKHLMEIVAFDTDDRADGNGKAGITWISKDLLATSHEINPARVANTESTGALGGWEKSEMRTYLKGTIKPLIPETVRNAIVPVTKISNAYQASDETAFQQTTTDDVWIPGHRELFNSTTYDKSGVVYSTKFNNASARIKKRNNSDYYWWTRSANNADEFRYILLNGREDHDNTRVALGVALGFCTNESNVGPVTEITDSWATIVSKINNGTANYKIGQYKPLDLGTEGIVNMQIVGKNTSPLASGSGTATYDWLSMELLATDHRMNPSNNNNIEGTGTIGGWEKCEMRTYLKETIKPLIPETVRNAIKEVTKYSKIFDTTVTVVNNVASTEDVWIPSAREIFGGTSYETQGPIYDGVFTEATNRVKSKVGASSAYRWWLRTVGGTNTFYDVTANGGRSSNGSYVYGIAALALGFSL